MGDWQPSAVGSKAFSCSRKIESVLVMIPRHLLHSNFSDLFPLCIAFGLCFMPSCRAGTSRAGRRVDSPNKNSRGDTPCPMYAVSGETRAGVHFPAYLYPWSWDLG